MPPNLENSPNEIIESIIKLMPLSDICRLRQSNRTLATKVTQAHSFRSYFTSKHVDITSDALRSFVDATQPGRLGCLIQNLVLVGVVNNTRALENQLVEEGDETEDSEVEDREGPAKIRRDIEILTQRQTDYEQLHESATDVRLLSEAFRNISTNSKNGKLISLSLEVVVYRENSETRLRPIDGGSWKFIWKSVAETFRTAWRSLAASGLPIESLNIFNDRQLQRCSLPCNELGSVDFEDKGLTTSLASLKSLSLSFSDRIIYCSSADANRSYDPAEEIDWEEPDEPRNDDDISAEAADERNFIGLGKLLQLGSQLQDLELHQYRLPKGIPNHIDLHRERLFQYAAEMDQIPKLSRLELRGLFLREEDLLDFVRRTNIRKLSMTNINLVSGTFRSTIDYCTSQAAGMEELCFERLYEGHLTVYWGDVANHASPSGVLSLRRVGAEVQQPIPYRASHITLSASPALILSVRQRKKEYGPP